MKGRSLTRQALLALAFAPLLALLVHHAVTYYFLCDDAFISFRYARNLVDGHGLVFNRGERVEGYTNFLWVIELAGLWKVFGLRPETASIALSAGYTVVAFALAALLAATTPFRERRVLAAWLVLLLLASNRSFAVWTTGGLETRQFTAFALLAFWCLQRRQRGIRFLAFASGALAAAAWTRPEGLLLFGCCGLWYALDAASRRELGARGLAAFGLPCAVLVGAHFAFRLVYYGQLLPNTYYAKHVRPWLESGSDYLAAASLEYALYLVVPLAVLGTAARLRLARDSIHLAAWACILPHAAYLAWIGGDHFEYRPLDFYWPLLYLAAVDGILALRASAARRFGARAGAACAVAITAVVVVYGAALPWAHLALTRDLEERRLGLHVDVTPDNAPAVYLLPGMARIAPAWNARLARSTRRLVGTRHQEHKVFWRNRAAAFGPYEALAGTGLLPPDAVAAVSSVGILPFYLADLTVIDTRGLTDPVVAGNPDVRPNERRRMAHDRRPPPGYLEERGVNLRVGPAARTLPEALARARYAVAAAEDLWLSFDSPDPTWVERAFASREVFASRELVPADAGANRVFVGDRYGRGVAWVGAFDGGTLDGWTAEGDAMEAQPVGPGDPRFVEGGVGALVNSLHPQRGDAATGTLRSRPFVARAGQTLVFLVGGGRSEEVGVRLVGEAGEIATWRGANSDALHLVRVPLAPHAGRRLWLEIFDASAGAHGHVVADHFLLVE